MLPIPRRHALTPRSPSPPPPSHKPLTRPVYTLSHAPQAQERAAARKELERDIHLVRVPKIGEQEGEKPLAEKLKARGVARTPSLPAPPRCARRLSFGDLHAWRGG